jgi:hypothetical protein
MGSSVDPDGKTSDIISGIPVVEKSCQGFSWSPAPAATGLRPTGSGLPWRLPAFWAFPVMLAFKGAFLIFGTDIALQ